MTTFEVGDRVSRAGHDGTVMRVETGVMAGMYTVRFDGGQATVSGADLEGPFCRSCGFHRMADRGALEARQCCETMDFHVLDELGV